MDLTNREAFFEAKSRIEKAKVKISDSELYTILIKANKFSSYTEIITNFDKNLAEPQYFFQKLDEIIAGKPIQYAINLASFLDFDLYIDERVLIPRPETEGLVLLVKDIILSNKIKHDTILDVCTGSGCIALFMKGIFPDSKVYASDKSKDALDVAKINDETFNGNIIFLRGDKLKPIIKEKVKLDVLISNPPYVENKKDIESKVKKYEPMKAIYSRVGEKFYLNYFKNYKKVMKDKFIMAFEINYDQEDVLTKAIEKYFKDIKDLKFKFYKDIYGLNRYLIILRGYENANL